MNRTVIQKFLAVLSNRKFYAIFASPNFTENCLWGAPVYLCHFYRTTVGELHMQEALQPFRLVRD